MSPILAFDIETIPDVPSIRLLYDLPSTVEDADVVVFAQQKRRAQTGGDFMQHQLFPLLTGHRQTVEQADCL